MCTDTGGERPGKRGAGRTVGVALAVLLGVPAFAQQETPAGPAEAIREGSGGVDLRYRIEVVDDDASAEDAEASTLRLRLNYETAEFRDWSAFVEFDYVAEVLLDDFDSGGGTSPDRAQYPVVADPHGADLNQLYFDYDGFADTLLRVGRQRILLDNQRFVGGVGWRQNEQTYDALTAKYSGIEGAAIHYSYVTRVNRIFGDRSPAGRHDTSAHLLNVGISLPADWTVTPYAYLVDNDDLPGFSIATVGARLAGAVPVGERRLALTAEAAGQTDWGNAPIDYDAAYLRLDAALPVTDALTLGAGLEVLGGDADSPGEAFRTPLATLHAFQGWADQFLATPSEGIEDLFVSARVAAAGWTFSGTWHDFSAADGPRDWGSELDLSAARPLGERYGLLVKAAFFDADDAAFSDVSKFWVMLTAGF